MRIERAFEILGDKVPEHLREAGKVRLQHREVSLEELTGYFSETITKDALAGRLRRLMSTADKLAKRKKIPNTHGEVS
jgi:DNA-binding protein WhiA